MELEELLKDMVKAKASDVFVLAGLPLAYKVEGRQERKGEASMRPADTEALISQIYALAGRPMSCFADSLNHDDDFSFALPGTGRFRVNVFRQRGSYGAVVRVIPFDLPTPEALNIPPEVMKVADLQKGLVLVTGPAGAGKTSTLACIIDMLNSTRHAHIITMEDPIEYVHSHRNSIVTQREVPTDVSSYAEAMRSAMRESPDILLLGEMRDPETIAAAMTAAEMAQLLFSTLHTTGAANTVDRIVDAFPPSQQHQIRMQLSMVLEAVVSQQLVPAKDGSVVPAFEIMYATPAIRNLIREGKSHQIDSVIAAGGRAGMRIMDQSLYELASSGVISEDVALQHCVHQESLAARLRADGARSI